VRIVKYIGPGKMENIPSGVCWCSSGLFDPILRFQSVLLPLTIVRNFDVVVKEEEK